MSRTDTWMPLYIGDYLADTTHLSMAEHGAYLLLIMTYWRTGPLPDNDKALANMAKCDRKLWMSEIGPVIRSFFCLQDGKLHHKRIDQELCDAAELSAKKQAAANARWGAKKQQKASGQPPSGHAGAYAGASPDACAEDHAEPMQGICPYAGVLPSPSQSVRKSSELRSGDEPPPLPDARAELWQVGLGLLGRMTGKPPKACRTLLGQLLRPMRDDCAGLLAVLREAEEARPVEPVAWLQGAVRHRTHAKPGAMDIIRADWNLPDLLWHTPQTDDEPMGLLQ